MKKPHDISHKLQEQSAYHLNAPLKKRAHRSARRRERRELRAAGTDTTEGTNDRQSHNPVKPCL